MMSAVKGEEITEILLFCLAFLLIHYKLVTTIDKAIKPLSPVGTIPGSCLPAVRGRGSFIPAAPFWAELVILDRVKQFGNVLLSCLIHLDHCPLHKQMGKGKLAMTLQQCFSKFPFIPLKKKILLINTLKTGTCLGLIPDVRR